MRRNALRLLRSTYLDSRSRGNDKRRIDQIIRVAWMERSGIQETARLRRNPGLHFIPSAPHRLHRAVPPRTEMLERRLRALARTVLCRGRSSSFFAAQRRDTKKV